MKPKVFVAREIPDAGLSRLAAACEMDLWADPLPPPRDILLQRVRGVEGLIATVADRIDGDIMDAAGPQLKVVSNYAVGYDNIDVPAARARGIHIGNTPGVLTETTADLAFTLLLASARRVQESISYVRGGYWQTWGPKTLLGADVTGATLGIIGLGRIGQAMARRARGFDMRILAYGPHLTQEQANAVGATAVDMDTLLGQSDFVSLHTPLNANTRHLINAETLAKMKPTAILINSTRGPVVDQKALYDAAANGVIGGAALDVTDPEPMDVHDPLLTLPNVLILPHVGSATIQTRDKMAVMAAENLIAGVTGQPLPTEVK